MFAYGFCPYAVRCLSYTHSNLSSSSRLPLPTQSSRPYLPSPKLYMYISRVCARAHAGLPQTKDLVIIYFYTFFFYIVHNMELRHQDVYTVHPAHVLFGPLLLQPNCWGGIGSITLNVLDRCILDISTDILAEIRFILRPFFFLHSKGTENYVVSCVPANAIRLL